MGTLVELFELRGGADDDPFVIGSGGLTSVTYGEAWAHAARLAHAIADSGVRPGDRVAVQVAKSTEALLLYLGCVRAGAVLVPLNPASTAAELSHLLGDAEPTLVIADPAMAAAAHPAALTLAADGRGTLFDLARDGATSAPRFTPDASTVAAMVYTSGTTGRPKGAVISHGNLASNAAALVDAWGFSSRDRLLHMLPIFHVHGLFVATNTVIGSGSAMILAPRFDVDAALELLPAATVMMGVPTFYTRLLGDDRFDAAVCRNARLIISGSAPLLATTHDEFRARTGQVILERYGMTETSMLTSNPLHGTRKPGTVGPPLPGVRLRIVDAATGTELEDGDIGAIEVSGPNVFGGYWRRPDLAGTEFTSDGFFRTGDIGVIDPDGYVTIVGRHKDLIITGGLNVYPKEIEAAIDAQPGVLVSAVIGVPDKDFGEAAVAVVVPAAGARLDPDALRESLRTVLAGYKVPKQIHLADELPLNAMGKVEKARLRARYS